jgi:hypothetical protein
MFTSIITNFVLLSTTNVVRIFWITRRAQNGVNLSHADGPLSPSKHRVTDRGVESFDRGVAILARSGVLRHGQL